MELTFQYFVYLLLFVLQLLPVLLGGVILTLWARFLQQSQIISFQYQQLGTCLLCQFAFILFSFPILNLNPRQIFSPQAGYYAWLIFSSQAALLAYKFFHLTARREVHSTAVQVLRCIFQPHRLFLILLHTFSGVFYVWHLYVYWNGGHSLLHRKCESGKPGLNEKGLYFILCGTVSGLAAGGYHFFLREENVVGFPALPTKWYRQIRERFVPSLWTAVCRSLFVVMLVFVLPQTYFLVRHLVPNMLQGVLPLPFSYINTMRSFLRSPSCPEHAAMGVLQLFYLFIELLSVSFQMHFYWDFSFQMLEVFVTRPPRSLGSSPKILCEGLSLCCDPTGSVAKMIILSLTNFVNITNHIVGRCQALLAATLHDKEEFSQLVAVQQRPWKERYQNHLLAFRSVIAGI
jgi:hypothetical protein